MKRYNNQKMVNALEIMEKQKLQNRKKEETEKNMRKYVRMKVDEREASSPLCEHCDWYKKEMCHTMTEMHAMCHQR